MKRVLIILVFILLNNLAFTQNITYPNSGTFGIGYHRGDFDSTLYIPTGCGVPVDTSSLFSQGFFGKGQKIKRSAVYFDTCGHKLYTYDPSSKTWAAVGAGSGLFLPLTFTGNNTVNNSTYDFTMTGSLGSNLWTKQQTGSYYTRIGQNSSLAYLMYRDLATGNRKTFEVGNGHTGFYVLDQVDNIGLVGAGDYWFNAKLIQRAYVQMQYLRDYGDSLKDAIEDGFPDVAIKIDSTRFKDSIAALQATKAPYEIDVFIVAGQSNAKGGASLADTAKAAHPIAGTAYQYKAGTLQSLNDQSFMGGSPWPAFSLSYNKLTGRVVSIIPVAFGGSTQTVGAGSYTGLPNWDTSGTMLPRALDTINSALAYLSKRYKVNLKGVLWIQGESDGQAIAASVIDSTTYRIAFQSMIARFRTALLKQLPFYIFKTGYYTYADRTGQAQVQAIQQNMGNNDSLTSMVYYNAPDNIVRGYRNVGTDSVHWNYQANNEAGKIAAEQIVGSSGFNWQTQANNAYFNRGNVGINTTRPIAKFNVIGPGSVSAIISTPANAIPSALQGGFPATNYTVHGSGNYGLAVVRATNSGGSANLVIAKTRNDTASVNAASLPGDLVGNIQFMPVGTNLAYKAAAQIFTTARDYASDGSARTDLSFVTLNSSGGNAVRLHIEPDGNVGINTGNSGVPAPYKLYVNGSSGSNPDSIPTITSPSGNYIITQDASTGRYNRIHPDSIGGTHGSMVTDLSRSRTGTTYTIESSTGMDLSVDMASASYPGMLDTAYWKALDSIVQRTAVQNVPIDITPTDGSNNPTTSNAVFDGLALKADKTTTINGHALSSNVTVTKTDLSLGNVDNTSDATKNSATATLTNKRITQRIGTTASSSTPTPDGDANDIYTVTALAANATFAAPTGTPTDGQALLIRIKDNGTSRTLSWNAIYRAGTDIALPTATTISKTLYIQFIYNSTDTKWDCVGLTKGF